MRRRLLLLLLLALPALPARGDELTLVGPDGAEVALRPEAGQVLLLHFWATWCPDCEGDLTRLQRAAAACSPEKLRVIAVDVGESEAEVAEFVSRHGVELPVLRDPRGHVFREVDGRGLPANLFWSEAGRHTDVGPRAEAAWRAKLASLGCEAAPSGAAPAGGTHPSRAGD